MWQIPKVSTAAVDVLASTASMTDTAVDMFLSLQAHPACILPLLKSLPPTCFEAAGQHTVKAKHILLSNFGDLEAVWADPALQEVLLGLRLPAMDLLLSFDELKVASEDTVLFTAQAFLHKHYKRSKWGAGDGTSAARDPYVRQLGRLVRCQHISQFWLTAAILSNDSTKLVLGSCRSLLKKLLIAHSAEPGRDVTSIIAKEIKGAPDSWVLPPRVRQPLAEGVQLQWGFSLAAVKDDGLKSMRTQQPVALQSPTCTPPLGGVTWRLRLQWEWDAEQKGTCVGIYAVPTNLPAGFACSVAFTLSHDTRTYSTGDSLDWFDGGGAIGWGDFFNLGWMQSWDDAAWAEKGLPVDGELKMKLVVHAVGHVL